MALNHKPLPARARAGPQRPKINGDENAINKHMRQPSAVGPSRVPVKIGPQRPALGEVTTTALNRRESKVAGKEKEETGLKRSRSSTFAAVKGPQRIPLGPVKSVITSTATSTTTVRGQIQRPQRLTSLHQQERLAVLVQESAELENEDDSMDIEEEVGQEEVEAMVDVAEDSDSEEEDELEDEAKTPAARVERQWPEVSTDTRKRYQHEVNQIREQFSDEVDMFDMTMVSEYSEEIFEYMGRLEMETMPSADYINGQTEITWEMRQTLVDWLLQVHLRYHMLPETLWIAINIVDRFLTRRVVSVIKLQLVGVTAMFIAAKYEEILAPSVDEFVFMTENGYTREEILKGERIVLATIDFKVSGYCSPYSWVRRISKADDYDIQTRTLSKFLMEVTLLDHRFLRVKPSHVAAIGMYTARKMLGGTWDDAFVFYSGFTEAELAPGHRLILEKLSEEAFDKQYVCRKYANKKFLKASVFAVEWACLNVADVVAKDPDANANDDDGEDMLLEE